MSTGLALLGVVIAALAAIAGLAWAARARRLARRGRRLAALAPVAERIDAALASVGRVRPSGLREPEAPRKAVRGDELSGRAGLVDALRGAVAQARVDGSRLTAALIESDAEIDAEVALEVRATADAPVYVVGHRALALVLPGLGRAAALGMLARIQAEHGLRGQVVEYEPGETAVELAARLLGQP